MRYFVRVELYAVYHYYVVRNTLMFFEMSREITKKKKSAASWNTANKRSLNYFEDSHILCSKLI